MSPTNKRLPPKRNFDDYVLTLSRGKNVGFAKIPQKKFTQLIAGLATFDNYSSIQNIGFDFNFNNTVYTQFVVGVNGYMILVDPQVGTFQPLDVFSTSSGGNVFILSSFLQNHVLLGPWLGGNTGDMVRSLETSTNLISDMLLWEGFSSTSAKNKKTYNLMHGIEPPNRSIYDPNSFGCSCCTTITEKGKALIVRWNVFSSASGNASGRLTFEAVLYENGAIEYNYAPVSNITYVQVVDVQEIASVGIFLSSENFRDFATELQTSNRENYVNGGAVYTTNYADGPYTINTDGIPQFVTTNYASRLHPLSLYNQDIALAPADWFHWPTQNGDYATFTFAPPMLRKKVLPRKDIVERDSYSCSEGAFNDKKSVVFGSNVVCNFPTTLQRNYDSHTETNVLEQNLFSTNFLVTASVSQVATNQFLNSCQYNNPIESFSDLQSIVPDDSSLDFEFTLKQPSKDKTRINLSFPVIYNTQLLPLTSSMYYYNKGVGCWNIPQNSSYIIIDDALHSIGNGTGDLSGPASYDLDGVSTSSFYAFEDFRGFGAISNLISSGSTLVDNGTVVQTNSSVRSTFTNESYAIAMGKKYKKSIQHNQDYNALVDETFQVNLQQPFVIEKVVIDLPCAMGNSWFQQKTKTFAPINATGQQISSITCIDFTGPALTCALFNQIKVGNEYRRDLICTGTIIPVGDNTASVVLSQNIGLTDTQWNVIPEGFLAYSTTPSAVVTPNHKVGAFNTYTGSVNLNCDAAITNGVIFNATYAANKSQVNQLVSTENYRFLLPPKIYSISPLGRAATGFEQSGRSIFGKEHCLNTIPLTSLKNPFYIEKPDTQQQYVLSSGTIFLATANIPYTKTTRSPYMIYPGDNLVLAVSKTRPIFYGRQWLNASGSSVSGSTTTDYVVAHTLDDIQLISGTINITLYGSYIQNNRETRNFAITSSPAISDVIGNDLVLDQYDVAYSDEYAGTTTDNYITGSLLRNVDGVFISGNRGVATSIYNSELTTGSRTTSLSYDLQPWRERTPKNSLKFHTLYDYTERFYDTLLPDISKCLKINGSGIAILQPQFLPVVTFDYGQTTGIGKSDYTWTRSFPFEPRYASAQRLQSISTGFTTNIYYSGSYYTGSISQVKSFIISDYDAKSGLPIDMFDYKNTIAVLPATNDLAKVLYGFGDKNTRSTSSPIGTTNYPAFRYVNSTYNVSPVIRGTKYGVHNVTSEHTKCYVSSKHHGFIRDIYEQRNLGKFTTTGCVTVQFVDATGKSTQPQLTFSQNLSYQCTSSIPYIDNIATDRIPFDVRVLNSTLSTFSVDNNGNLSI